MIRDDLKHILGEELRFLAIETRERLDLSQKEMGERLQMSYSNYSDIETGRIDCCSTLTAVLLLCMQEDPAVFLDDISQKFRQWYASAMISV